MAETGFRNNLFLRHGAGWPSTAQAWQHRCGWWQQASTCTTHLSWFHLMAQTQTTAQICQSRGAPQLLTKVCTIKMALMPMSHNVSSPLELWHNHLREVGTGKVGSRQKSWIHQWCVCVMAGSIELLVARSLGLMTSLTEYEDPTFLDQTIIHEKTRDLAIDVAARASRLAGNQFSIETLSNATRYSASK